MAELERYAILATPAEPAFDRITRLCTHIFHCSGALLGFVAEEHQWFKSCRGQPVGELPRTDSLCAWAILSDSVLVIPDARADSRLADHPLVTGSAGLRFYAAAPLLSSSGYRLGTLCLLDTEPRPRGLSLEEVDDLTSLAALAMGELEARLVAQEAEKTYRLLQTTLDSIGDGVIVTDIEPNVTFINRAAEEITGWTQTEGLGRPLEKIFHIVNESSRERVDNPVVRAVSTGKVVGLANHTILLTRDGREVPIDDSAAPIGLGGTIVGGVLVFRDVTRRREAERALEYSENQYRATFANAPLGLVLTHLNGNFIQSNQAYQQLTGYTDEELPAISFLSLTHPDDLENNRRLFHQLLMGEIDSYVLEKRIFNRAGELRWVRAHAALIRNSDNQAAKVIGLVENITDRKQAEERFRFLADSIPQMVWTATPNGLLDYTNAQGAQYFETTQDSLLGDGWLNWVHPDDQAIAVEKWTEALATGNSYETEFRLRQGITGDWRLHLVRARPFLDERGQIVQWFGTCTDIEDQHRTARQIEEDRRRWREILLQTPAAIAGLRGPNHVIEWVNRDYELLVGRSAAALINTPLREALPEVATQVHSQLLDDVYRKGEPLHGHEASAHLGKGDKLRELYVDFAYLPTRNPEGVVDGVFVHITDVTERVSARRAIEDSERQFRTLAETIPHLTWTADETGNISWYNRRWFEFTGTTLEEMSGWGWEKVHDPKVLPHVLTRWNEALSSGQPFEMIFPLKRADGVFRSFLTRVEPIHDRTGKVARWFGTNTDITDQQRVEEKLRRMNRDLEEFSYVASHDLQEPLRMVNIYTQLLLKKKGSEGDFEAFAGYISQGVKRMQTLIQDLLRFSQTVHSDEQAIGTADLSAALSEAMGVLETRISETGAVVTYPDLPLTRGDTRQMAHVFQNVLGNALKYRKATVAPRIDIEARREQDNWVIAVRDNGIGFDPQYSAQIFGLFKRLHNKDYEGTGLGLAICKRIVDRYGGQMWADSNYGQGSTFYFSLPSADP